MVGYGTQKRVNVTGAVSVIDGKDLQQRPVTNAVGALQGADPSLLITTSSGTIESKNYNVSIRGTLSLNSGEPLILVDGVEGSLTQLNPNDIASISVLKDASATAIYGTKGSAGVILITTKSGEEGKLRINYNGRYSISDNTTRTDFMTSSYDYVTLCNEFYTYLKGYGAWTYSDDQMEMLKERRYDVTEDPSRPWVIPDVTETYKYVYLGNYDWYGHLFNRTRPETEHNISVSGGNDKVNYYASGRYLYREGFLGGVAQDTYNGFSFRSKVDVKVTPWLVYSNNLNFERTQYSYGGYWEIDGTEGLNSTGELRPVQPGRHGQYPAGLHGRCDLPALLRPRRSLYRGYQRQQPYEQLHQHDQPLHGQVVPGNGTGRRLLLPPPRQTVRVPFASDPELL